MMLAITNAMATDMDTAMDIMAMDTMTKRRMSGEYLREYLVVEIGFYKWGFAKFFDLRCFWI